MRVSTGRTLMPSQNIISLRETMLPAAVETFSQAFREDELYKYIVPDGHLRIEFLRTFFTFRLRYGMKFGEVQTTSDRCEGVAIWIPFENRKMTVPRILRSGGLSAMRTMDADTRRKLMALQEFAESARRKILEPHWHLSPIAVHPDHQGQGLASFLIRSMLERLDKTHSACLLETQTARNVSMYQRFGFKVMDEGIIPGSNVRHWVMWRDAVRET
jgi:ribosomal protein S18 acetylase RimI-like enzyme